ncbi:SusD/RagB family nutrient-binding outer membrane lipoprotein [Chitinophaga qingshengii]|uniref:SusD/RagB family nutrient-binding outer membrane lipoprotein n=1 Tax=Chitinophaga qingshengii TaxID=1569794 RepID=A0ABR7TG31_9BACT|nr:SusD/RagB family nutrient-binding outer membrane lipoprotein [Chitinophaga qingshengii]MBC9929363.1 SusD/RagB family nutrient-binding outer membrane lipoprotein [Chitinophaga qingshengii]
MKKYFIYMGVALGLCTSVACTKNFEDMQHNPETLKVVPAGNFLNAILFDGVNTGLRESHRINNELMQVTVTEISTTDLHRYFIKNTESDYPWENYYLTLNNVRDMRTSAKLAAEPNSEAVALTLWAWLFQNLTDIYGDIPYQDALRGYPENQLQNRFDPQQDIYRDLIAKLDTANRLFVTNGSKGVEQGDDLLFNSVAVPANIIKWKKLCNSLRLRLLMRIAHKSPEARQELGNMLAAPDKYPVMANNDESAVLKYTNIKPFQNPFFSARDYDFNGDRALSTFFADKLTSWNDPRLPVWCKKASDGVYRGIPSGYKPEQFDQVTNIVAATLNADLKKSNLIGTIMTYAEVELIRAEAIMRGYATGNAQTAYENGVKASVTFWNVPVPADFLTRPGIAFNNTPEQVLTQKYFALFFNDMQQWFEYRRTGFPVLPRGEGIPADRNMPARMKFPIIVQTINAANYQNVVQAMGGDEIATKVWWQK